jgi:hypothetical protein
MIFGRTEVEGMRRPPWTKEAGLLTSRSISLAFLGVFRFQTYPAMVKAITTGAAKYDSEAGNQPTVTNRPVRILTEEGNGTLAGIRVGSTDGPNGDVELRNEDQNNEDEANP